MPFRVEARERYMNGRLVVQIYEDDDGPFSGMPYCTLSTNVPGVELEDDEFVLNHDLNGPLFDELRTEILAKWCEDTGKRCSYGFVRDQPIWRVALDDTKVSADKLKAVPFPECGGKCAAVEYLGVGECEAVCPHKFDGNGDPIADF